MVPSGEESRRRFSPNHRIWEGLLGNPALSRIPKEECQVINPNSFEATAWNNGAWHDSGAGFGLKISAADRDDYFERVWKSVTLRLVGERTSRVAEANVAKKSFRGPQCRELIKLEIGQWFIENGFHRWPCNAPPRFRMFPVASREFEVRPYGT